VHWAAAQVSPAAEQHSLAAEQVSQVAAHTRQWSGELPRVRRRVEPKAPEVRGRRPAGRQALAEASPLAVVRPVAWPQSEARSQPEAALRLEAQRVEERAPVERQLRAETQGAAHQQVELQQRGVARRPVVLRRLGAKRAMVGPQPEGAMVSAVQRKQVAVSEPAEAEGELPGALFVTACPEP